MERRALPGFSKLNFDEKLQQIAQQLDDSLAVEQQLASYLFTDFAERDSFLGFSENTISSYHLPYGVVPNLLLDNELLHIPVVTEESSVVAAASASAKFWGANGGFKTVEVTSVKVGQIHFTSTMPADSIKELVVRYEAFLLEKMAPHTERMEKRGGGVRSFRVLSIPTIPNQYQLMVEFDTANSMGANFINTCLEELAIPFRSLIEEQGFLCDILMCILSNYTPNCTVRVGVSAPIKAFDGLVSWMSGEAFARRFKLAVDVAGADIYRATTHNKGIMNGVDSVIIATGNDFRAVEAASHAFAARNGSYTSLSSCSTDGRIFSFELELPLALGVIGGLTGLHPLAKRSLELLGNPSATKLMSIAAAVGLASNFAAVKSLITSGIQQGHMKMHLHNILKTYNATQSEVEKATSWFANRKVSNLAVKEFLDGVRG